ncbi:MAG: hypothetical protein PF542_05355 [Nanoarchaeota archaeon]|jgi:hypothetical protein|nr:hypothetical protein [Nanoarchaeota archaeon]
MKKSILVLSLVALFATLTVTSSLGSGKWKAVFKDNRYCATITVKSEKGQEITFEIDPVSEDARILLPGLKIGRQPCSIDFEAHNPQKSFDLGCIGRGYYIKINSAGNFRFAMLHSGISDSEFDCSFERFKFKLPRSGFKAAIESAKNGGK